MATSLSQAQRNRLSEQKLGKKQKAFTLDARTVALFDVLSAALGLTHVQLLRDGLETLAQKHQIDLSSLPSEQS